MSDWYLQDSRSNQGSSRISNTYKRTVIKGRLSRTTTKGLSRAKGSIYRSKNLRRTNLRLPRKLDIRSKGGPKRLGISRPYFRGKLIRPTEIEEPSLLEVIISSVNNEDAILTNVYTQHNKVKAIIDTRVKLNLIYPGEVERLKILYQKRKEPIILRTFNRTNLIYGGGKVHLETQKQTVRIKDRLFNIKFIITKLSKEGIILGIP